MKILSSYKDYYDYVQGTYGVDEKVVFKRQYSRLSFTDKWNSKLQRREKEVTIKQEALLKPKHLLSPKSCINTVLFIRFAICGVYVTGYIFRNRYYFGVEGAMELYDLVGTVPAIEWDHRSYYSKKWKPSLWSYDDKKRPMDDHLQKAWENDEYGLPVLLVQSPDNDSYLDPAILSNPRLSDFGIAQVIKAEDMWIMLNNWLTREKPVVDKRTDKQKIEGHGFDTKTSFRHPIK